MKRKIILLSAAISCSTWLYAQSTDSTKSRNSDRHSIKISIPGGIDIYSKDNPNQSRHNFLKKHKNRNNSISTSMVLDLGLNNLYNAGPNNSFNYLVQGTTKQISGDLGNVNSLSMSNSKSINVNFYPLMANFHLYKKAINLSTGLGFNWYNFRMDNDVVIGNPITSNSSNIGVTYNSRPQDLRKNKFGVSYLTLPISLQFKPRFGKNRLVFGGGISEGYLLKGWNKTKDANGTGHTNMSNVYNNWITNLVAEIGIDDKVRFYGTYGITDMYKTPFNLRPITFGVRLFGL